MLKTKVIASDITNLTDARYFAARGVDYLMFYMKDIDIEDIIAIKEWVSGPKIILYFDKNDTSLIDEAVLKIEPYALCCDRNNAHIISYLNGHLQIAYLAKIDGTITIELANDNFTSSFELSTNLPLGIIVQGSDESKIGFKNYDQLDELFDLLEK